MINPQLIKISRKAKLRDENQMTMASHQKPFSWQGKFL
jgi:hypothetical protein